MHTEGFTLSQIGSELKIPKYVIKYQLDTFIKPAWRAGLQRHPGEELARVDSLERRAWGLLRALESAAKEKGKGKRAVGSVGVCFTTIQWCISERCKILGHYAKNDRIEGSIELRVVGKSPDALNQEMLARLQDKIAEHRRYAMALANTGSEN